MTQFWSTIRLIVRIDIFLGRTEASSFASILLIHLTTHQRSEISATRYVQDERISSQSKEGVGELVLFVLMPPSPYRKFRWPRVAFDRWRWGGYRKIGWIYIKWRVRRHANHLCHGIRTRRRAGMSLGSCKRTKRMCSRQHLLKDNSAAPISPPSSLALQYPRSKNRHLYRAQTPAYRSLSGYHGEASAVSPWLIMDERECNGS